MKIKKSQKTNTKLIRDKASSIVTSLLNQMVSAKMEQAQGSELLPLTGIKNTDQLKTEDSPHNKFSSCLCCPCNSTAV